MDRIFDKTYVNQVYDDIKSALKDAKECMEDMQTTANDAITAYEDVPSYAQNAEVETAATALKNAIENIDIDTVLSKLLSCKTRATALIPNSDSDYAAETKSLIKAIDNVKDALSQMKDFMIKTSFYADPKSFAADLKVASKKWNKVLKDSSNLVDQIKNNIKGAEAVSVVFSEDPVNLNTGNFIYDKTDLEIGGSEPFIFRRFYNAINKRKGSLGYDWNHNYEIFIEEDGEEIVLILEEGKEERFISDKSGKYSSIFHSNGWLEKNNDNYHYYTRGGKEYFFDIEGRLTKIILPEGDIIELSYNKDKNLLEKVEKQSGESFAFVYNEEGIIKEVADHIGRKVCYTVIKGHLISVISPLGHKQTYEYDTYGKLTAVGNPRGISIVENEYDSQFRTISQSFPDGSSMSYEYNDEEHKVILTERNGSKATYVHDNQFRDIKRIYSDGEERFEYNKRNQKTLAVDKLGNKTQYAYDDRGNTTRIIDALGTKTEVRYEENNLPISIKIGNIEKIRNTYDKEGCLLSTVDALGNKYSFSYKHGGKPRKVVQPDGSEVQFSYDNRGNISEIIDAHGAVTSYEYDLLNRVIKTKDPNGNITCYEYDDEDNLTRVTNAQGKHRDYTYNEINKVTQIKDFDSSTITREYNSLGKPSKVIDQLNRETTFEYDKMWNLARVTEPDGARTTYVYNEHNHLARIRTGNGDVIRFAYDALGNRKEMLDEEENKTSFTYDALGNLTEVVSADGSKVSYAYDYQGNVTCVRDALGGEVNLTYDAMGNLICEENPMGESRKYTYNSLGGIDTVTDEAGLVTQFYYEKGGRLKELVHPDKTKETYTYDMYGNVTRHVDRLGYANFYTYDELGQTIEIKGGNGTSKKYGYDAIGNITSVTDELGNITKYQYSLTGQILKVIDAMGNETSYTYDVKDRLVEICRHGESEAGNELPYNQITRYERDSFGQITKIIDPIGQIENYKYDKKGQLIEKIDKEGYLTKFGYTPRGDLSGIQYEDGREVKLSYNALQHLQKIEDWLGVTSIETDLMGRAKKVTYPDKREVSYRYGAGGECTVLEYPDGTSVKYGYDECNRLDTLTRGEKEIKYKYNETGYLAKKILPNGIETDYRYNNKGNITELIHSENGDLLDKYSFDYDALDNRTMVSKERKGQKGELYSYQYDALYRLKQVNRNSMPYQSFSYDSFSNRTEMISENHKTSYKYNDLNQLISKSDGLSETGYSYDKRGNLIEIIKDGQQKNRFLYGALNRLEESRNGLGDIASYRYNGLGHRVGKNVKKNDLNPTAKIDYIIDYTKEFNNLLEKEEQGEKQTYIWDGFIAGMEISGEDDMAHLYTHDEMGSPNRLLGITGVTEELYDYDTFGEEKGIIGNSISPFRYIGYTNDDVAGTYYAQAREYFPEDGRFAGRDLYKGNTTQPITLNEYIYCGHSPLCYVDVDGRFWHIVAGAAVGAVANVAISVGTSIVKGEKIDGLKLLSTAVGGAVTGGVTAATGNPTLGAVAGGTVERVGNGVIDGKSAKEICKDVVVGAATDVVFAKAGKAIAKQPQVQKFTESFKSTKLGKRIFDGNTNFKRQITRGRNAFTKENGWKKIVMRKKTYFNGFWGVTGTKALDKSARVALFHGMDPKDSIQEIIALLYDSVYMNYQIQKYVESSLKKIYDEIEREEIENALCVA